MFESATIFQPYQCFIIMNVALFTCTSSIRSPFLVMSSTYTLLYLLSDVFTFWSAATDDYSQHISCIYSLACIETTVTPEFIQLPFVNQLTHICLSYTICPSFIHFCLHVIPYYVTHPVLLQRFPWPHNILYCLLQCISVPFTNSFFHYVFVKVHPGYFRSSFCKCTLTEIVSSCLLPYIISCFLLIMHAPGPK